MLRLFLRLGLALLQLKVEDVSENHYLLQQVGIGDEPSPTGRERVPPEENTDSWKIDEAGNVADINAS
jgi:hypothetical protein